MNERTAASFADLALDTCLSFRAGDRLRVQAEFAHRPLVHAIAAKAWERGARDVRVEWSDPGLSRIYFDKAGDGSFDSAPTWVAADGAMYADEGWCVLVLKGDEDPAALDGVNADRLQRHQRSRALALDRYRDAIMSYKIPWTILPVATEAWGRAVFAAAGRDPGPDAEEALWEVLAPILYLDRPDPRAALLARAAELRERSGILERARLSELRFSGPGTDLSIGLSPRSRWAGADASTPDGRRFMPNHPTEEVFTSPDCRLATGRVACTRPVKVLGETVIDAWFEFREGKVTASGAKKGADTLARYLDVDSGSRRLGEVALVDALGPIWKSGFVFDNILLDENAACHIALGSAYVDAFEGSGDMSPAERAAEGYNESLVHTDFMIGSPEVDVEGRRADGSRVSILKEGVFVLKD